MDDMMGGYFGLELPDVNNFPYRESPHCAYLNSGRSALACLLDNMPRPRRIYLPRFACHTLYEPCLDTDIPLFFYGCHADLTPQLPHDSAEEDLMVLINYFGLSGDALSRAASAFPGRVIIDATTALFAVPPEGTSAFYSPRKFAGVCDGGIALAPFPLTRRPQETDTSASRALALIQRTECGALAALPATEAAEATLRGTRRSMSPLTRRLLRSIDFDAVASVRLANYQQLHRALAPLNRLTLPDSAPSAPMCYPLVCGIPNLRDELIDAGVALPLFWPEVIDSSPAHTIENRLARTLLPLPLDQRYDKNDIEHLLHLILG